MARHVLLINLGPVQDLIAAARKCRDLWFGSWVLSELSKAAAEGVASEIGAGGAGMDALVFPAPRDRCELYPGSRMSVANKLVVRVPGDGARVREVAEKGRARMRERLQTLREEAFERIGKEDPRREQHFLVERARQQVDELYDYVWVAVPEEGGEDGYAKARAEAERLLAARKNARAWKQPAWALEGVPKSSLDGVRESVLHEDIYERPVAGPPRAPALKAERRRVWYGVHGAERLCGVGLFKRWGVQRDAGGKHTAARFFSTAHLAALPLMLGIDRDAQRIPGIEKAWAGLCKAVGPAVEELDVVPGAGTRLFGHIDGAILFRQRLSETLAECGHDPQSEVTTAAIAALKRFLDCAGRAEPLPYYAILAADGDGMGRLILEKKTAEAHRDLSRKLDEFARRAREIVHEHDGCLIYSGGDDVLAFLPLHRAIECAYALATRFKLVTRGATLSAGLAIVHYVNPMGAALEIARRAEKEYAKVYPNEAHPKKDALAVMLDKRSGGTTGICGHWDDIVPRLRALTGLHEAEAIPDNAGHELTELARLGEGLGDIKRSEAIRILGRKRARRGKEKIAKDTLEELKRCIGEDPAELGRTIEVAALIAKARKQASPGGEGA